VGAVVPVGLGHGSVPAEQEVYHPAAAHVGPRTSEVREDARVRAAGVEQRVSQDAEAGGGQGATGQEPLPGGGPRQGDYCGGQPGRVECDRAKGVAEDVPEDVAVPAAGLLADERVVRCDRFTDDVKLAQVGPPRVGPRLGEGVRLAVVAEGTGA